MKLISRWTGGVGRSMAAEVARMCPDKWCLRQESKSRIKIFAITEQCKQAKRWFEDAIDFEEYEQTRH